MLHPRLTDAGIYTLLWTQHVGLWIALFYLVAAVATSLIVRTGLGDYLRQSTGFLRLCTLRRIGDAEHDPDCVSGRNRG